MPVIALLYDETGNINPPVVTKDILILDPVSRFRMEDIYVGNFVMREEWKRVHLERHKRLKDQNDEAVTWFSGFNSAVKFDMRGIEREFDTVIEEGRKTGLTSWKTIRRWWKEVDGDRKEQQA